MEYLSGSSSVLLNKLQSLGHDTDSLHIISKDFFSLCDQLSFDSKTTAETFMRLKKAHDYANEIITCDLLLYENNRINPTRLCVENNNTKKMVFFQIIPGQPVVEKKDILYNCEMCSNDTSVKRTDAKSHFLEHHN